MGFGLVPEYRFDSYLSATPEFLRSIGVRGIVLDIDNTLEPYENPMPGDGVTAWLSALSAAGISAAIVSNNGRERVELFNSVLSLPAYWKAKKPFPGRVRAALSDMGVTPSESILMGDQVFTDVLAAHTAGIPAILVPPIRDKKDLLTKFKRVLERPVLRAYERRKKKEEKRNKQK